MISFNLLISALVMFSIALVLIAALVVIVRRLSIPPQPAQASGYGDDVDAAVARVRGRFNRRARFASHAVLFGGYALAVFVFLLDPFFWRLQFGPLPNAGDLALIGLLWGLVFAAHAASAFVQEAGDRALQREIEAARRGQPGKPKRSLTRLLLTDDGEIEMLAPDQAEADRRATGG